MPSKADIWMPIYIGDYLADTSHLDAQRHGCYLLWMMHYWRKGPLANSIDDLVWIGKLKGPDAPSVAKTLLSEFFDLSEDGFWHQKRLDVEREKAQGQKRRGVSGANAKWGIDGDGEAKAKRSQRLSEARLKGTHTDAEWSALQAFCRHLCVRCGSENVEIVKDHIIPIYKGGSDGIDNIQPLCRKCNASKGPETTDHRPSGWRDACKMPAKCLQNDWTSPSPSPLPSSLPTEIPKAKKQRLSPQKKPAEVDPRRKVFIDDLKKHWDGFAGTDFVFDGADGKQVDAFLAAWPKLTQAEWRSCLRNRKASKGVIPTERIHRWIGKLGNYLQAPLDEYNRTMPNGVTQNATVPNGTGNQLVGVLERTLNRRQRQRVADQDGDLPAGVEVGRDDAGSIHGVSGPLRLTSVSSGDAELSDKGT